MLIGVNAMQAHIFFLFAFISGGITTLVSASGKNAGGEQALVVFSVFLFLLNVRLETSCGFTFPHAET